MYDIINLQGHFLLSKQYIGRLFRTYMGTTVTHYINDQKLLHAPELLCQTVLNVSEIASYLGFSNVHYFSRLFKAKYNESLHYENGYITIPDKPGLGIELNEEACLAHPYQPHTLRHYTGALTDIRPPETKFYF